MLDYNEITQRTLLVLDGEPYECVEAQVSRKSQGKPSNQTKLKHLKTGKVVAHTFHVSAKTEEAIVERRDIKYLYQKGTEVWFCAPNDPKDRFTLPLALVERELNFIKQNDVIQGIYFDEEIIGVKIPLKVELEVTEAADAVKGNTSSGATKRVTLENGYELMVPLFIKQGDFVIVNTDKAEYSERGGKG